jgi:demethylmenaquinone methyltransferase/2-methoxy-6-polyprenyl-1,4-benzoquinol methylase
MHQATNVSRKCGKGSCAFPDTILFGDKPRFDRGGRRVRDFTTREQVEDVYHRLARHYDLAARFLNVLGFGYVRLRHEAVEALMLKQGDTVLEIGCGTGANFPILEERIGPTGRIIGIDLTRSMLDEAEKRVKAVGWNNIELVQCPAKDYPFREQSVDAAISTFVLTLEPDYDSVIASVAAALRPDGRFAIADLKLARGWRLVFLPFLLILVRPFAVSLKLANRHPWESMQRYCGGLQMTESLGGYLYVASAIRPGSVIDHVRSNGR